MSSLTEQFVKEAERRILTGAWRVGMKLPPLRTLAEEFHVSRSVINAGIVELCNNGYLVTVPRRYICVSDWRKTGSFAVLTGLMENGLCDEYFFDDLLEGRMTIEKAVAIKAARSRTEEDVRVLREIAEREKTCPPAMYAEIDQAFHHAVAVASHNVVYSVILNSFNAVSGKYVRAFYDKPIDRAFVLRTHDELTDAIEAGDEDAAGRAMERLLIHGESALKNT